MRGRFWPVKSRGAGPGSDRKSSMVGFTVSNLEPAQSSTIRKPIRAYVSWVTFDVFDLQDMMGSKGLTSRLKLHYRHSRTQ